ncbi:polyphosphate kinase 2 family protein [Deinococcus hohokamensis]|uniref:Polyphosphate kinase 2 family protein n=1 Tax=Deinococcus hohokamensis TaxID=309883 RepID=A0ABV9IDB9_9DEIO
MNTDPYRVPAGQQVKLSNWDTHEAGGLDKAVARLRMEELSAALADWQEKLYAESKQSLLVVLQARDAGGKDGVVKKVIGAFNPNGVHIANFKVPSEEERAHDFLWRIHAQVPRQGMIGVFNRSHYEDVLVTRVYNLIGREEAEQRLDHIRNFEALLSDSGTRVVKFYLHISKGEQKERLQARLDEPDKQWKFNPGDLKDRAHWDDFTHAYETALATSTADAPWYVIPADRKWFRDLLIAQILVETLANMNPQHPALTYDPSAVTVV